MNVLSPSVQDHYTIIIQLRTYVRDKNLTQNTNIMRQKPAKLHAKMLSRYRHNDVNVQLKREVVRTGYSHSILEFGRDVQLVKFILAPTFT
jgi:hypothetical protein